MRAIHFMMIDYIKMRQQLYFMPLFLVIALALWGQGFFILVPFAYMLFVAIIFATAPFGTCRRGDAGFLILLPSTAAHRILGRFLYGMSFVGIAVISGGVFVANSQLMGQKTERWMLEASLILLALCILIITLEFLILYLVGEHLAPQLLGIVRVAPPMAGFFAMMYLMDDIEVIGDLTAMHDMGDGLLLQAGCIALAAALVVLAVSIVICVKVTQKRDYV